jgi:LmbE family N-acetylglucosaminyl deacetylase
MGITEMKRVMFVVAHPDDETLMGGGFLTHLRKMVNEATVAVVTLASRAEARSTGAGPEKIANKQEEVFQYFHIDEKFNYGGRDSRLINEDHLDMVQFVENAIKHFFPQIIITHYPFDTHKDHQVTSQVVSEAFRYFQRPRGDVPCQELWYGEVPSSTDWGVGEQFHPNVWIHLQDDEIEAKVEALKLYDQVIRPMPHPRAEENIEALARIRGAQCGAEFAEAFQQVFRVF